MEVFDERITEDANKAAMSGDLDTLKSIVAKNPKVLLEESEGRTPISIFIDKMDDLLDLFDLFAELPVEVLEEEGFLKDLFHTAIDAIKKSHSFEDKRALKEIKDLVEENFETNFEDEPIDELSLSGKK